MEHVVIVPLDGSSTAERSLPYLHFLSPIPNLKVELLLVDQPENYQSRIDEAKSYLTSKAEALSASLGLPATAKLLHGVPYLAILQEAQNDSVALIVTTTRGQGGTEPRQLGSVADKLIRGAPCPTLVVGPHCSDTPGNIERLLVLLDGSDLAEIALPVAGLLARKLKLRVELFQVVASNGDSRAEQAAREYLEGICARLAETVEVECVVRRSVVREGLIRELEQHPEGIVVMSSHGSHGFRSYALGATTNEILLGPLPALIVGPGQASRIEQLPARRE
jgi:nucleotide-binding universal stress UspA family protein